MDFAELGSLCIGHAGFAQSSGRAGLVATLFLAGLSGSVVHCGPMCGPFVLAQAGARLAAVPATHLCERARVREGLLLPYHLGRLATYGALGAAAASAGAGLGRLPALHYASAAFLSLAAGLFLWQALTVLRSAGGGNSAWRLPVRLLPRLPAASWARALATGLLLGFLPCGLLYGALVAAAGASGSLSGALGMIAFGLGTSPILALIGIVGHSAMGRLRRLAVRAGPAILVANALLLLLLAWSRVGAG